MAFTLYVDPGRRVYVRRINIIGNARTRDEVIRREMRQLEGAWYDGQRIDRSKVRIKRLGYFDDVNVETPPVAGSNDQVDLEFTVTEKHHRQPARRRRLLERRTAWCSAPRCRSRTCFGTRQRARGGHQHQQDQPHDFRGSTPSRTGRSTACRARSSSTRRTSTRLRWRCRNYESSTLGAGLSFGVPISESDTINLGGRIEHTKISLFAESPPAYYPVRQRVRRRSPTATSSPPAGRATRATTSSTRTKGGCRAFRWRLGCRWRTLRTTRPSTSTSGSGRSGRPRS